MRKWGALAIGGVILISLATPVNAAAPKAGATCTKKNATATSAGKLYTCILSGKKLVWNKGVAQSPKPAPQKATPPITENINSLRGDVRITSEKELTNLDVCKTTDMTQGSSKTSESYYPNGFPRPSVAISGKKVAKVLVIPMSFKNLTFNNDKMSIRGKQSSDIEALNLVTPRVIDFYKKLSNGKFELQIEVLPESEWWDFNFNSPFINAPQSPNSLVLLDLIRREKPQIKFGNYDSFVFLGGYGQGYITGTASYGDIFTNSVSGTINTVLMVGAHDDESIWVHEFGHSLFALEDLYLFNPKDVTLMNGATIPTSWDLMASNKQSLLRWNRLLMGWLPDNQVRCINEQKTTVHFLSKSEIADDPQLLTINISEGVTLAVEARGSTTQNSGALIYVVNTHIQSGMGPIQVQKYLLNKGESLPWIGWKLTVLDSNDEGVLVEATKTDIDKFVPPPPQPKPSNSPPPSSIIKFTKGEVVSTGGLKARGTWDVQGQQSYRVYVTAADDFQKVFFESGYLNDARSQLILEISGLVCNRELRTVTEFYSEKDGKGERLVVENRQLGILPCNNTPKKP